MEVIREHNGQTKALIGKGYVRATWIKYQTTEKHIGEFLKWKYKASDVSLRSLKFAFVTDLEFFLKSKM